MQGNQIKRLLRRGGASAAAAAGVGTLVMAFSSTSVMAAGNRHFHNNMLSASVPTGFTVSPQAYDLSHGAATVNFSTAVKNVTSQAQTTSLNFSVSRILMYNGQNVADGQPGQPGLSFKVGNGNASERMLPGTQTFSTTWQAGQTLTLSRSFSLNQCGYFQIDVWAQRASQPGARNRETLASGFVRALGCTTSVTTTPTPTTTTASGGVQAISVPSTGSALGSGELGVAGLLLITGAGLLAASARRHRLDI